MPLDPRQTVRLTDSKGRYLGAVSIQRIEGNRVFARFSPAADFALVERLFLDLEEAANDQLFSSVDQISGDVDRLGLRLASEDCSEQLELRDVQIMNRHDLSCRVPNLALIQTSRAIAEAS